MSRDDDGVAFDLGGADTGGRRGTPWVDQQFARVHDSQPASPRMSAATRSENAAFAASLRELADLLEHQGADGFRAAAYRRAADTVDALKRPVPEILATEGRPGFVALPAVGWSIASALAEMVATGRWGQLERLRGAAVPEELFQTIAGIGPALAAELSEKLNVETLEGLETAAHDGSLEKVKGIGPRRAQMIRAALFERLGRTRFRQMPPVPQRPTVEMLLDVDREYRERTEAGTLRRIAPRRFNPKGEAWLPILHARRGEWTFTALFSNTALAHKLGRTRDWVVVYHAIDGSAEGRSTVVTERVGSLEGHRVVRGREEECRALLAAA